MIQGIQLTYAEFPSLGDGFLTLRMLRMIWNRFE